MIFAFLSTFMFFNFPAKHIHRIRSTYWRSHSNLNIHKIISYYKPGEKKSKSLNLLPKISEKTESPAPYPLPHLLPFFYLRTDFTGLTLIEILVETRLFGVKISPQIAAT